jgi:uncharacterized membrane protein
MHCLLDNYMTELSAHLVRMPKSRRAENLREMRAHLEDAVAAGAERGISEEDAARQIARQFGSPAALAEEELAAWRWEQKAARRNFWKVVACFFGCMYLWDLSALFLNFFAGGQLSYDHIVINDKIQISLFGSVISLILIMIISKAFPRQAISGLAAAVTVRVIFMAAITPHILEFSRYEASLDTLLAIGVINLIEFVAQSLIIWLTIRLRRLFSGRAKAVRA